MYSYTTIFISIAIFEIIHQIGRMIIQAYTGPLAKIPGPFWYKFSFVFWYSKVFRGMMFKHLYDDYDYDNYFRRYGTVVRVAPREVLVAGVEGVRKVLVELDLLKAPYYEYLKPETPHGKISNLITENNQNLYKKKRRFLSPGFSIAYLNGLEPLMKGCVDAFEKTVDERIAKQGGLAVIDAQLMLANLTYDVMAATSLGGSFNLVTTESTHLRDLIKTRTIRTLVHGRLPWLRHIPFSPPLRVKESDILLAEIVAKRKQENKEKIATGQEDTIKRDLLQILMDSHEGDPVGFTEEHVKEEMLLFMIAGTDTTSHTLTSALHLILHKPSTLRALEEEILAEFPNENEEITFGRIQDLPYLNGVINESLRCMPVVLGGLNRFTEQSIVIDGYIIPPGTQVVAEIGSLLKDPLIWPDPEDFVPERWLGMYKGVEVDRRAFLPLGAGRHVCIGQQFAMKEMRLVLASIIRRYEIVFQEGQDHGLILGGIPYFEQGFYNVGFKLRERVQSQA